MHPRLREGVSMGTFSYAGQSGQHYYVENDRQEMFELSYPLYCELARADGTCHLRITKRVLRSLQARRILTTSRWQFQGIRGQLTLVAFGRRARPPRRLCRVLNRALVLAFLPVLLAGLLIQGAPTRMPPRWSRCCFSRWLYCLPCFTKWATLLPPQPPAGRYPSWGFSWWVLSPPAPTLPAPIRPGDCDGKKSRAAWQASR